MIIDGANDPDATPAEEMADPEVCRAATGVFTVATITYSLSTAGQRVSLLAGGDGKN